MQQLGEYVVTLTVIALISSILLSLFPEGSARTMVRLVCGVILTVTALSPVSDIQIPDFEDFLSEYMDSGQSVAAMGEAMAEEERLGLIKLGLEAYILDKAAAIGCETVPDIQLNKNGNPIAILISGDVSEYQRQQLQLVITNDLGIPKEDQQWTGEIRGTS